MKNQIHEAKVKLKLDDKIKIIVKKQAHELKVKLKHEVRIIVDQKIKLELKLKKNPVNDKKNKKTI
jgi:hypothetical protein